MLLGDPLLSDSLTSSPSFAVASLAAIAGLLFLAHDHRPSLFMCLALLLITASATLRVEFAAFFFPVFSNFVNLANAPDVGCIWLLTLLISAIIISFWKGTLADLQIASDADRSARNFLRVAVKTDKTGFFVSVPIVFLLFVCSRGKSEKRFAYFLLLATVCALYPQFVSKGDGEFPAVAVARLLMHATLGYCLGRMRPVPAWVALAVIGAVAAIARVLHTTVLYSWV
jgi:hypothetical protein